MDLGSRNKIKIEGGMASMTDLVFLLLIFFIIMSLMSNQHTPIDLPKPDSELPTVQDPIETVLIITEDNKYYLLNGETDEDARELELIKEKVMQEVEKSGKLKLKIAGHRKASYDAVFQALALSSANGWEPALAYQN
jgi:biopolymer transport protein ExbD